MVFQDSQFRSQLRQLFRSDEERFDLLLAAAGLDPAKDLVGADLRNANFSGSLVDRWNLTGCDLTGVSFVGARVFGVLTTDAVGLDLSGAIILDFPPTPEAKPDGELALLFDQIQKSANGAQRGPLIQRLMRDYPHEERVWDFLIRIHLRQERTGKYVSLILNAWERVGPGSQVEANRLRIELLEPKGTPYITVRGRLLREIAARLGPTEEVFDIAKRMALNEGEYTSGAAAMSVLGDAFAGDDRAASVLKMIVSKPDSWGASSIAATSLLEGFDSKRNQEFVRNAIRDRARTPYQRSGMLYAYCRHASQGVDTRKLIEEILRGDDVGVMKGAAVTALSIFSVFGSTETLEHLRRFAQTETEEDVRIAAIDGLSRFGGSQTEFLVKCYKSETSGRVRRAAVTNLEKVGFQDNSWFTSVLVLDQSDLVRGAALSWLLNDDKRIDDIRELLIGEASRIDPGYASARAGFIALSRWPESETVRAIVERLVQTLPKDMSNWRSSLSSKLQEISASKG